MTPEVLARVFSPFYTSKDEGQGSASRSPRRWVEVHGGSLEASSAPGSGAEFVVSLPRLEGEAAES